jgi:hypothetical protein
MKRLLFTLAFLLMLGGLTRAQYTTVSGTIVDANGVPYGGAKISAQLTTPGATITVTNQATCTSAGAGVAPCQIPILGTVGPTTADATGTFNLRVPDNTKILPASTQWVFTVTIAPGVAPPFGTGPQAIGPSSSSSITISGASQNIGSMLSALAPALTVVIAGGGNVTAAGSLANGDVITGAGGKAVQDSGVALSTLAPLASPTFTGVPAAPTATLGTSTTQLATTAFVQAAIGTSERLLSVNVTPVTAAASTTANQVLMQTQSPYAAGTLNTAGKTIRLAGSGVWQPVNTTEIVAIGFSLGTGANVNAVTSFTPTVTGVGSWSAFMTCTVLTTGAAATWTCSGSFSIADHNAVNQTLSVNPTGQTSNLTGAISPQFYVAFGTASATNSMTQNVMTAEQLN